MDYIYVPREEKLPWVQDMNKILLEAHEENGENPWFGIEAAPELEELFRTSDVQQFLKQRCRVHKAFPKHFSYFKLNVGDSGISHEDKNSKGTLVSYLEVSENIVGGKLRIGNYELIPRSGDLIYIGPHVVHSVSTLEEGYRLSGIIDLFTRNEIWE